MLRFALFLLLSLPGVSLARAPITIGFNPAERTEAIEANAQRLSDYVTRKAGVPVKAFVAKDYESLVGALQSGKVDFAFLPPFSFVKAETRADAKLLLQAVRRGQPVYHGALLVRADSGIEKLEDLKGKSIAWVEKDSAAGYIVPKAELRRRKLDPDTFLGKQTFRGTHDAVVRAVFQKEADVGATWSNDTEGKKAAWQLYLRKPEEVAQMKMLFVSGPIPGDALATTGKLWRKDRLTVEKVTKVLRRMGEALDGQQILRDLYGIDQMVPASPKDFDTVRSAARFVGASSN